MSIDHKKTNRYSELPKSCTSLYINIFGLIVFLLSVYILSIVENNISISIKIIIMLLSLSLPIIFLEVLFKRHIISSKININNIKRVPIKLLSLYSIWVLIAFIYWLFPEYKGNFYQPFWDILTITLPWLVLISIPYFLIVDGMMKNPEDAYYTLGLWILGRRKIDKKKIIQLFLGWLVKLFFLPLMIVYLKGNIEALTGNLYTFNYLSQNFKYLFDYLYLWLFTIDLAFVCIGYVLTLRLLDSHIRSTEPTLLGWVSAIICYQPLMGTISPLYLAYNMDNYNWGAWLEGNEILYTLWGIVILLLLFVYALSSVAFGIRFSNLTHRGIITNGPYRYSKHPAYLSKNLSWWMISIPFISQSNNIEDTVRSCLMLLLMNYIYFIRAKTEETHLLADDTYVQYSSWISRNGLFSNINNLFVNIVDYLIFIIKKLNFK